MRLMPTDARWIGNNTAASKKDPRLLSEISFAEHDIREGVPA